VGPGQALFAGETLATSANGRLALALADRVSVRLDRDTRITLLGPGRISVSRGALYVDSGMPSDSPAPGLLVETPAGAVHHLGTQYEARVMGPSSEVRVSVREGRVELDTRRGAMHRAAAGEQLSVSAAGTVVRSAVLPYDPRWRWVVATAPAFNIDGHSVAEFLTWSARELGRDIVYADAATQAQAARVMLSGSISGLSPDQALAAVLPTTPLRSEVRNGQLLVSLSEASR
jgi:ferric-dicitrate binding protein FerR (iron transport regulator)